MDEPLHLWSWWLTDEVTGKRYRSRWLMTEATAAGYPGAVKIEGTLEVRGPVRDLSYVQTGSPKG